MKELEPQPEPQVLEEPRAPLAQAPAVRPQGAKQLAGLELGHPSSPFCAWQVEDCAIPLIRLLKSCPCYCCLCQCSCQSQKNMKLHGDGAFCLLETCRAITTSECECGT